MTRAATMMPLVTMLTAIAITPAVAKEGRAREVVKLADQMEFKEVVPGVSRAVLWGNPDKGSYGALTKFKAGTTNALHTHPNDIHIVVLQGAYIDEVDGRKTKVGPGSYMLVPAGLKHVSGAEDETLFLEQSAGKFGLSFVKPKK